MMMMMIIIMIMMMIIILMMMVMMIIINDTCSMSCVTRYEGTAQLAVKFERVEFTFILALLHWLELLTDEEGRKPEYSEKTLHTTARKFKL